MAPTRVHLAAGELVEPGTEHGVEVEAVERLFPVLGDGEHHEVTYDGLTRCRVLINDAPARRVPHPACPGAAHDCHDIAFRTIHGHHAQSQCLGQRLRLVEAFPGEHVCLSRNTGLHRAWWLRL